ncbi:MAG: hypothetical protein ACKVOI_12105 [Dongiaceae bacterium]
MNVFSRKRALRWAIIGSFAIYLIPIVGPHSIIFSGLMLLEELAGGHDREVLWRVLDVGLAVFLQALFAALLYLQICWRRWWGWLLLVPALPVLFFAQSFGFQLLIPTLFLVESDPALETGDWPRICELEGQWLDGTGASADLAMERAREVWVMTAEARRYSILTMPDCRLQPIAIPAIEAGGGVGQVRPGGGTLYRTYDKSTQKTDLYVLPAGTADPIHPSPPADLPYWNPIVTGDGTELAWLANLQSGNSVDPVVRIRPARGGAERTVLLPKGQQYQLLAFDDRSGDFLLSYYPNGMIGVGPDGTVRWGPFTADGLVSIGANLRRAGDGWIAWDSYRDEGRYRIVWSLPAGSGSREIPKGRSIAALSVSPDGVLVAVSTSPSVSLGNIADAVFVFKAADGNEVYRRTLPAYSRSNVQFIGNDYLAMYEFAGEKSRVVVLQVVR